MSPHKLTGHTPYKVMLGRAPPSEDGSIREPVLMDEWVQELSAEEASGLIAANIEIVKQFTEALADAKINLDLYYLLLHHVIFVHQYHPQKCQMIPTTFHHDHTYFKHQTASHSPHQDEELDQELLLALLQSKGLVPCKASSSGREACHRPFSYPRFLQQISLQKTFST